MSKLPRSGYKLRCLGVDGLNIAVTVPRVFILNEAKKRALSLEEFMATYLAIPVYNSGLGILQYTFHKNNKKQEDGPCKTQQAR